MLTWNPYDFIEYLGVLPEIGEYDTCHSFTIEKDGLKLLITIWQYDGDACIDLYQSNLPEPVCHLNIIDCPGARRVKNQKGYADCLEFAAAKTFGSRYDGESVIPLGVRVFVDPQIKIELF